MITKKLSLIAAALLFAAIPSFAKNDDQTDFSGKYRRSSLCSFLVSRTDQKLHDKIEEKYLEIPTPDQYNDHDLSVRILSVPEKGTKRNDIESFLERNGVASRIVAKWFDRNQIDGKCDMDLIKSRGLYNSSELDRELAGRTTRGLAMLEDAGEELIGNTFVLVHEASYIDHAQRSKNVATGLRIFGAIMGAVAGAYGGSDLGNSISDLGNSVADMAETFKGFRVKFHTSLYQLQWDEETAGTFYKEMYAAQGDEAKKKAFENHRDLFKLKYIGDVTSGGSKVSFLGISEEKPEIMVRKACQRAIDDNVRDLQKNFEVFRVKSPISKVLGNEVEVAIGMKEGVNADSVYEILEPQEENGKTKYKKVGTIKPVNGKIMDNRYMAAEEGAVGSDLHFSTFKITSGHDIVPGMLVRQVK